MAQNQFNLPVGSLILVTGANGNIDSHVMNTFIDLGYRVQGTIRERKPWLSKYFN
jgi:nucleoside-diphosphate-sugar epimerase